MGYRHVTGIKEWAPAEKAEYIARLVDGGMSYREVIRAIGSKTPTVRQNYLAYKLFRQLEELDSIDVDLVERRFSLLFLSLHEREYRTTCILTHKRNPPMRSAPYPMTGWII